jgi:hypothetical protein
VDAGRIGGANVPMMTLITAAAAVAATAAPASPAPPPHIHYEFRVTRAPMSDGDRMQAACDLANYLLDDLKKQKRPDRDALTNAEGLRSLLCPTEKSN